MTPKARRIPYSLWEQYKDEIIALYYSAPKGTLKETMQAMRERHDFHATKNQYTTKFKAWGLDKYANHNIWAYADQKKRKRKLEEGKDTEFEIRGRKRSKSEVDENIARNVTYTNRLQLGEDIPTPEGVQVFTPVAGASAIALREVYIDNLPFFQLLRSIGELMLKTINNPTSQLSPIFSMVVHPSKHIGSSLHSSTSVAEMAFGDTIKLFTESGVPNILEGKSPLISHLLQSDINNNEALLSNFEVATPSLLVALQYFMWQFIFWINCITDRESFAAIDWMLKNVGSSFLCNLFRLETIAVKTFMRAIFLGVVNSGNTKVAKSIIDRNIDIKSHEGSSGCFYVNHLQKECMEIAIKNRDNPMVELLCQAGFSPRINEVYGPKSEKLPWHTGNLEVLKTLLSFESNPECLVKHRDRGFPLVDAANSGSIEAVEMLLMAGCRINVYVPSHFGTPLQAAIAGGHMQIAKFLIDRGADLTAPCDINYHLRFPENSHYAFCNMTWPELVALKTPVEIACYENKVLLVEMLLSHGALADLSPLSHIDRKLPPLYDEARWISTALQYSVQNGNVDIVYLLLSFGADPNFRVSPDWGDTPLQISARCNYPEIFQALVDYGADVNAPPATLDGRTAIQAAAEIGDLQLAQTLLGRGANINAPAGEKKGFTALQAAIKNSHSSMVSLLLGAGADVNAPAARAGGLTAIQAAAKIGDFNLVRYLVEHRADVNIPSSEIFGITAVNAALRHKNTLMLEFLVEHGANIDGITDETPPIMEAAESAWIEGARYLLKKGADVNAISNYGSSLSWSIKNDDIEMVDFLWENGGNLSIGPRSQDALWIALTERCSPDLISLLLSKYAVSGPNYFDKDVLAAAMNYIEKDASIVKMILKAISKLPKTLYEAQVRNAWFEIKMKCGLGGMNEGVAIKAVNILLVAGAEVNAKCAFEDETLLQFFIDRGYLKASRNLVEKGAEIQIPASRDRGTPLQDAIGNVMYEVEFAFFLLEHGADINARPATCGGRTALQAAIERGHDDLISDLLQRGADVHASPAEEGGVTALQAAAILDDIDLAILLIQHGAHVAAPAAPYKGRTAINGAAECGNLDMLQLLLNHYDGCEDLRDFCQEAAHYAEEEGYFEIARWLRGYTDP